MSVATICKTKQKLRETNEALTENRLDYYKHTQGQVPPVEMHSPQPGKQDFRAELADNAPKAPRSP